MLGYCSCEFMLKAQCLGLNTWWVGGTFCRKKVEEFPTGGKVIGIVAFGISF